MDVFLGDQSDAKPPQGGPRTDREINGVTYGAPINGLIIGVTMGLFHPTYRSYNPTYNW